MKKLLVLLVIITGFSTAYAQTAKFYADTTVMRSYTGSQKEFDKAMEMQWLINGKPLSFGSDTVEIIPDKNVFDTIFYKRNAKAKWDTIICNIAKPNTYAIRYNACCGAFDIVNENKRVSMKLRFSIKGKSSNMYLARLGETAKYIVGKDSKTITPLCRSAMKPNIFWVMLQQVEICTNEGNCEKNEEFCLQTETGEADYDFSYTVKKTIAKFLYLPLDDKPLRISYKPEKGKLKVK